MGRKHNRKNPPAATAAANLDDSPPDPKDPWRLPWPVSQIELAFPAHAMKRMPAWADIPAEFKDYTNRFYRFVDKWFLEGADAAQLQTVTGVDRKTAIRHLQHILGSYEPKHEHKMAAAAYLLSRWFTLADDTEARC
jgi:hypothetical protein